MKKYEQHLKEIINFYEQNDANVHFELFNASFQIKDVRLLQDKGLIQHLPEYEYIDGSMDILLTKEGRFYFENKRNKILSIFAKSVLTPIVVAFITTILTSYFLPWISTLF